MNPQVLYFLVSTTVHKNEGRDAAQFTMMVMQVMTMMMVVMMVMMQVRSYSESSPQFVINK